MDLRRRVNAAAALAGLDLKELEKKMGLKSPALYRALTKESWKRYEREAFLRQVAEATDLPYGFFTTEDFALLDAARWEGKTMPTPTQVIAAEGLMAMIAELIAAAAGAAPPEEIRERLEAVVRQAEHRQGALSPSDDQQTESDEPEKKIDALPREQGSRRAVRDEGESG